jgi:TolB-like protein
VKNHKLFAIVLLLFFAAAAAYGQRKPRLAVLPFTGAAGNDGQTIAMLLSNREEIRNVFTVVPRTSSIDVIMKEQEFQRSGITDSDTIAGLGKMLNADYVVAGHVRQLGNRNLVIITIINVESLQQVAGDYREYKQITDIRAMLPDMADKLAKVARVDARNLPKLAVLPFDISGEKINVQDAETLAQLLATEIANTGVYAVLPRTNVIEAAMEEQKIQRSGLTDPGSMKTLGQAANAEYVLVGNVSKLGGVMNLFFAQIFNIENGSILKGKDREYNTIEDGIPLMKSLALELTDIVELQKKQKNMEEDARRKTAAVSAVLAAAKKRLDAVSSENQKLYAGEYKTAADAYTDAASAQNRGDLSRVLGDVEKINDAIDKIERAAVDRQKTREFLDKMLWDEGKKLWSVGINAGSAFTAAPRAIVSAQATISLFPYMFIEGGCDFGFIHGYAQRDDVSYHSFYPFAHAGAFVPLGKYFLWYAGAGGGCMLAYYKDEDEDNALTVPAFDALSGMYIGAGHHYFNIGYTLRVSIKDTKNINHKAFAGYSYRF